MSMTGIRDPRLAQGFSALANAMFPDGMNAAKAQALVGQRDMYQARAGLYDAQSSQTWNDVDARRTTAQILTDPAWANDPGKVSRVLGQTAMMSDGLQRGPGFVVGSRVAVDPEAYSPKELSMVMSAQGQNYATTPSGVADTLAGQQTLATMNNNAAMDRTKLEQSTALRREEINAQAVQSKAQAARPPATINTMEAERVREQIRNRLAARLKELGYVDVKPENLQISSSVLDAMAAEATNSMAGGRNADIAISDAIGNNLPDRSQVERTDSWLNPLSTRGAIIKPSNRPPNRQPAPRPGAQPPAAPAMAAPPGAEEGATVRQKSTGKHFRVQGGNLVPID